MRRAHLRVMASFFGAFAAGIVCAEPAPTTASASPSELAFLDVNGDGIDDFAVVHHMAESPAVRKAHAAYRHHLFASFRSSLPLKTQMAIDMLVSQMREEGVQSDEVHVRIGHMLEESGIELPVGWYDTPAEFAEWCFLTKGQRATVSTLVRTMSGRRNTYHEIRQAIHAQYWEWAALRQSQAGLPAFRSIPHGEPGCTCGSAPSNQMYEEQ